MLGALLLLLLVLPAVPAGAHPLGLPAFVRLAATGADTATLVWNAAPDDVAALGRAVGVDVPEDGMLTREQDALLSGSPTLHAALRRGIVLRQAGTACAPESIEVDSLVTDGATLRFRCPRPITAVELEVRLLSDLDDRYLTLVVAGGPDGLDRWMLSGTEPSHRFELDPATADEVLAQAPGTGASGQTSGDAAFGGSLPFEGRIVELLEATPTALAVLLGILLALAVGAAHGLAPGHGKAIAAAYLVGDRARARDAVLLGGSVALMHTGSVLALGFALYGATTRISVPALSTWLQIIAGSITVGLGLWLLRRRWPERRRRREHHPWSSVPLADPALDPVTLLVPVGAGATVAPVGGTVGRPEGHTHTHDGGRPHTHLPAPDVSPLSWQGLVALGAAGGLLPSPSALLVLFTSLAVGRLGYGLGLIGAFSIGLALTVTTVGLAALWGRDLLTDHVRDGRADVLRRYAPVAAAAGVVALGAVVTFRSVSLLV